MLSQPANEPPVQEGGKSLEEAKAEAQRLLERIQHKSVHLADGTTYPTEDGLRADVKAYLAQQVRALQTALDYGTKTESIMPTVTQVTGNLETLATLVDIEPKY